jgi:hypothetical protein
MLGHWWFMGIMTPGMYVHVLSHLRGDFLQGFEKSNGVSSGGIVMAILFTFMNLGGNGWASCIGHNSFCVP